MTGLHFFSPLFAKMSSALFILPFLSPSPVPLLGVTLLTLCSLVAHTWHSLHPLLFLFFFPHSNFFSTFSLFPPVIPLGDYVNPSVLQLFLQVASQLLRCLNIRVRMDGWMDGRAGSFILSLDHTQPSVIFLFLAASQQERSVMFLWSLLFHLSTSLSFSL